MKLQFIIKTSEGQEMFTCTGYEAIEYNGKVLWIELGKVYHLQNVGKTKAHWADFNASCTPGTLKFYDVINISIW